MLNNTYLLTNIHGMDSVGVLRTEILLGKIVFYLEVILEIIALLIIATAILMALQKLFKHIIRLRNHETWEFVRLEFGVSLSLSLEFLLAADIVATAFSPSWNAIGKLAAITGIRTFLNFFLQKEVAHLEVKNHQTNKTLEQESTMDIVRKSSRPRIISRRK